MKSSCLIFRQEDYMRILGMYLCFAIVIMEGGRPPVENVNSTLKAESKQASHFYK